MLLKGGGVLLLLALASGDEGATAANGDCDRDDGLECDQPGETETARAVREAANAPEVPGPDDISVNHSVIATDYSWGKFLSVHSREWRSGGLDSCVDIEESGKCDEWAAAGECELNPSYLHQHCAKSCNFCRSTLPKEDRCVRHPAEPPSIPSPGGLNQMFERIINDPEIERMYTPTVMSRDPWVVVFENFVSEAEGLVLQDTLHDKWKKSSTVGDIVDGVVQENFGGARTSSTAWCTMNPCSRSEVHRTIQKRTAELTGTDPQHMEYMQILKYNPGEFYKSHHDNIDDQVELMCGPRLLTAFFYFSNLSPEMGGATKFTNLGFQVEAKIGRMVLWPSMMDDDSSKTDLRTSHEAMNVTMGQKYAANLWIHEFDYKSGYGLGCTGT
jgi:hypothetical protein